MDVVTLTKDNFEQEVLAAKVPVLIDFWATWCGPCQLQSPVVDEIAKEMGDQVKVCKVNVDEQLALAQRFGVSSIPLLILFKNGRPVAKALGYRPKAEIQELLKDL